MNTPFTDAADLVARSELATNQYDPYWQMSMYAKTIRLEIIGAGVHDIQDGIEDGSGLRRKHHEDSDRDIARHGRQLLGGNALPWSAKTPWSRVPAIR
jgi:hypothetical protein